MSEVLLDQDLRYATSRGELRLVYQPHKDLRTDEVVGFEALLRWNHTTRGEVLPAQFIPIAEESGVCRSKLKWIVAPHVCGDRRDGRDDGHGQSATLGFRET